MKILKSKNRNDNIFATSFAALERKYLQATSKYGVKRVKCVKLQNEMGWNCGAVLGYDDGNDILCANAFSEYCGDEMIIMVCVRRSDYLIRMAIEKITK